MQKFEYKVVTLKGIPEEDRSTLDEAGEQGWELVAVERATPLAARIIEYWGYLKKAKGRN